ncbi:MAG: GGDEF domain-containing protein [Oscillospiraceae bacterium]|nr:GGDEF domain-containing protein [Oscillospiraceae bacterium]
MGEVRATVVVPFDNIFDPNVTIDDKTKYSLLQLCCTLIHMMLSIIFLFTNTIPLVIFNIVSTVIYFRCKRLIQTGKYAQFCYVTFCEICLCAIFSSVMVGLRPGFQMYIIGIMPVIFYMQFSIRRKRDSFRSTFIVGILGVLSFLACKIVSIAVKPVCETVDSVFDGIYIYNALCMFTLLLFFSMVFLKQMQNTHTTLEKEKEEIEKSAGDDALTGILNRRSFYKYITELDKREDPYSFIICDIDNFKTVNDTYGHEAGDEVLKNLSGVLRSVAKAPAKSFRWGGEELVVLTDMHLDDATRLAERIRRHAERTVTIWDGKDIRCTITAGVAESTEAENCEELMAVADQRLYAGKTTGKNRVIYKDEETN